ncbi:MAG: restriction endonuclease subunit S [Metallibacterium sp.]
MNKTAPVVDVQTPYKMIRTTNVRDGWVDLSSVRCVDAATYEKWTRRQKPKCGDVILTREAPLGEIGMLRSSEKVFLGQRLVAYRADPNKLDNRFLLYAMLGDDMQGQIQSMGSGATVEHMRVPDCEKLTLRLPPLATQRRIAAILSAYDDLIENNTRRIAILEEMARRIYEEWFVRFRFPGHEHTRMVESELGLVPEGWKVSRLELVCARMNSGNTPSRSNPDYWDNGSVDWYKTKELWDGYLFESEERISEQAIIEKKSRVFEAGTILMAIYGSPTVGRLGITTSRATCNQAALGMLPDTNKITFWMLYYTLLALRAEFNNKAQGAAQQNVSKEKVAETKFIVPAAGIQRRFDEVVGPIQAMLRNLHEKNRNLRATRDLLLPRLISGELDVSDLPEPQAVAA